jgi:hypothetical protein
MVLYALYVCLSILTSPRIPRLILRLSVTPANLKALTVAMLDDTLPYLHGVHWDSVWVTHGCLSRYREKDMH